MIPRKIRPTPNHIVTTMDKYEEDDSKLVLDVKELAGTVKDTQKVVAIGPLVRDIKVGDYVRICPDRYIKVKHSLAEELNEKEMQVSINFPIVDLEDGRYLFLYESDVDYVIEEFAPETTEKVLYTPPTIIK